MKTGWFLSGERGAQDSELVAYVTDSAFSIEEGMEVRLPARGLSEIELVETDRGIQVMFDMVGPNGPQIEYGLIDLDNGWLGLSNSIVSGQLNSIDRSIDTRETMIVISSPGGWQIRTLIDDNSQSRNSGIVDQVRSSLGLDQESFEILVIGVSFADFGSRTSRPSLHVCSRSKVDREEKGLRL